MARQTKTDIRLEKLLREIWDNDEFVSCTFWTASTQQERLECISFIESHPGLSSEDVDMFIVDLYDERMKLHWKDYLTKRKSGFDADEEELLRLLEDVWEDYDFYILVLDAVTDKKARRELIQFLKSDPDNISSDDVLDYLGVDW